MLLIWVKCFYFCSSLENLDLSSFNTENVKNMSHMFDSYRLLNTLNLYNFNSKKVKDMSYMFLECKFLTYLNISNFEISIVKKKKECLEV